MKRSPLKRSEKRLARYKTLAAISKSRLSFEAELREMRELVEVREGYRCAICRQMPIAQIHHRLRRSQGGTNELGNLMGLCHICHEEVHRLPTWSYDAGYLLRRSDGSD